MSGNSYGQMNKGKVMAMKKKKKKAMVVKKTTPQKRTRRA
tara:strand:+ start:212 stop:331 length:120 start_codon:yes stop_codon:yes gene_type:complete